MGKQFISFAALLCCTAATAPAQAEPHWTIEQIEQLRGWLRAAPQEGLVLPAIPSLDEAIQSGEIGRIDQAMTRLALTLARAHLFGSSAQDARTGWHIAENDGTIDLGSRLSAARAGNDIDSFFTGLRPRSSDYEALRTALLTEADPERREILIRNLERWRWLPLEMGRRYLLVNTAGFELGLWENSRRIERWRVINGKPATPTPVFSATVTGITVNPWWEIPPSIVRELAGRLSSRRGYVRTGGRWRQRPGPNNALGQVKLVMPNPYNVYLHDTPNKALFDQPVRAFSHGCIRVEQPLTLAAKLLGRSVDAEVATGKTATLTLTEAIPVYVAYFTADVAASGAIELHDDIYGRDLRMAKVAAASTGCGGPLTVTGMGHAR